MNRVEELTLKLLDEELSEQEQAELEQAIESEPELRELHISLLEQEAVLRGMDPDVDVVQPTVEAIWRSTGDRVAEDVMKAVHETEGEVRGELEEPHTPAEDTLEVALAGAFDSVFSADGPDPFAQMPPTDPKEVDRRETRAYTQDEAERVLLEQAVASARLPQPEPEIPSPDAHLDSGALPEPPAQEQGDWKPEAFAALASLAEDEISSIDQEIPPERSIPAALDSDLAPARTSRLPPAETMDPDDPFAARQFSVSGEVDIERISGQSSMILHRPSQLAEPSWLKRNWVLVAGLGGGGVIASVAAVAAVIVVMRSPGQESVLTPPPVKEASTQLAAPGTTAAAGPAAGAQPANPGAAADSAATQPTAEPAAASDSAAPGDEPTAAGQPEEPKPNEPAPAAPAAGKTPAKPKTDSTKPKGETPARAPVAKHSCDPILYPDGNCPSATAAAATPAAGAVKDKLTKSDVLGTIKKNLPTIQKCIDAQRQRAPTLAEGTLKMQWYIRPDGRTTNVSILTTKHKGTYVGVCARNAIKKWRFPRFNGEEAGPIKFPFPMDE